MAEMLRHGLAFNGRTGSLIGGAGAAHTGEVDHSAGTLSVVLDIDEDGVVELVTGAGIYGWNAAMFTWVPEA